MIGTGERREGLVENALDAGSTCIEVAMVGGGLSLLRVTDNGGGTSMRLPSPSRAIARQNSPTTFTTFARSVFAARRCPPSLGGAAFPRSRPEGADSAAEIAVEGGAMPVRPVAANRGTTVEVRDLFFATPARLKFEERARRDRRHHRVVKRRAFPEVRSP